MQTSPEAQGAELPISEAAPRMFATPSLCTKTSISTERKDFSSHFSTPFAVGGFPAWHEGSVEKTHGPAELCRCWEQAQDAQVVSITLLCSGKSSVCVQN